MDDQSKMTFGKYAGQKLANVPASYLIWLYENGNIFGDLKAYIKDNMDVLKFEVSQASKSK